MNKYKHIFFDLDHTLWDYDSNSAETLKGLFDKYELEQHPNASIKLFLNTFNRVNNKLWNNFNKGHIDREVIRKKRFYTILRELGIRDTSRVLEMSDEYMAICPTKSKLFPYTIELLNYLKPKYNLHILTNGFTEVQMLKLDGSGLTPYFSTIITSESSGYRKPSKDIFTYALTQANAHCEEVVMVGDNLQTDIKGASNATIDTVFFNPRKQLHKEKVNYEITCLSDLMNIL